MAGKIEFTPEEINLLKVALGRALEQSAQTTERLKTLSNEEIGKLLFYHIWPYIEIFTPQSDLVDEAISRLGFVIPDEDETTDDYYNGLAETSDTTPAA
jgi:hypothetical protein